MRQNIKVNFVLTNNGVVFKGEYQIKKFESNETPLAFGTGDRSVELEEHQHYTFSLKGGVLQASLGFSVCAYDVHILEPSKAGAIDLDKTNVKTTGIDLVFRTKEFTLDLSDYKGDYKTNLVKLPAAPNDWVTNHSTPVTYSAIADIAFSISNGSELGFNAVWGKVNSDGHVAPMPDYSCGLATNPKKESELHLRTVSTLLYSNGAIVEVSGFPKQEFDKDTPLRLIRGTSVQIKARK